MAFVVALSFEKKVSLIKEQKILFSRFFYNPKYLNYFKVYRTLKVDHDDAWFL
jgi:hypothetical protein